MAFLKEIQNSLTKLIRGRGLNTIEDPVSDLVLGAAGSGGAQPRIGSEFLLRSYSTMPWLRAVTGKIGKSISATSWKLFIVKDKTSDRAIRMKSIQRAGIDNRRELINKIFEKGDLEEIEDHPLLDLLQEGNPRMDGSSMFELTSIHRDIVGEAFWILEKNLLGTPIAIWPIPAHWVRAFPIVDFPFYRIRIGAHDYDVPVSEVISFVESDPAEPYGRGTGIAKSLGDEFETDEFAAKHTASFFRNNAKPNIIVSADGLSRADTVRLEQDWNDKHRGFWNAFKAHFINRKIDVKTISQSFDDMKLKELREMERNIIMQVYAIPPEKLGVLTQSNRSTILSSDMFYTKDIITPRIESIRIVLQNQLVPFFDERLIIDYESPVVEDKDHQLKVMQALPGAFTVNEWRDEARRPSLGEDGEIFLMRAGEGTRSPDGDQSETGEKPEDDESNNETIEEMINSSIAEIKRRSKEKILEKLSNR